MWFLSRKREENQKSQVIELGVIACLLLGAVLINFVVVNKLAFLNLYYVPVLFSAILLGKRSGMMTSIASILVIGFAAFLRPANFTTFIDGVSYFPFDLIIWGSFLLLTGYSVGSLHEESRNRLIELKKAYQGVVEILAKYIDSTDEYTRGHSIRVANYSEKIAKSMGLNSAEVENIRVGGLLHDIGKIEISTDVIEKAATLTEGEHNEMMMHTQLGASLVGSAGGLLKDVVPIVRAHHEYYMHQKSPHMVINKIPLGARIVAVADAYDAITTDRPYRAGKAPWQAIQEIERESGGQFDPAVVDCFKVVIQEEIEEVKVHSG